MFYSVGVAARPVVALIRGSKYRQSHSPHRCDELTINVIKWYNMFLQYDVPNTSVRDTENLSVAWQQRKYYHWLWSITLTLSHLINIILDRNTNISNLNQFILSSIDLMCQYDEMPSVTHQITYKIIICITTYLKHFEKFFFSNNKKKKKRGKRKLAALNVPNTAHTSLW